LPSPGELVVVDFPGVQGNKRRPALVISSDAYHRSRPDVIVGLITSQLPSPGGLTDYILADWKAAGLNKPSAFRAFLVTLPRTTISSTIGRVAADDWPAIQRCVRVALAT
jgi:mRNA interferase MazF